MARNASAADVADKQAKRGEEAEHGGDGEVPDGADDRDEAAGDHRLVERALGRIRLRHAQRRPELGENLFQRRALVGDWPDRRDPLAHVRLDLPRRVAHDLARQKRRSAIAPGRTDSR